MSTGASSQDTQVSDRTKAIEVARKPEEPPSPARQGRVPRRWPFGYLLLWLVAVTSLLMNMIMLRQIVLARNAARQIVSSAAVMIGDLRDATITSVIEVEENLPIETDLPISGTIPVTIDQNVPIDTVVTVPLNAGVLGTFDVDVPIRGTIRVRLTQDVPVNQAFHTSTSVPFSFDIRVNIPVADTPFGETLNDVQAQLEALVEQLSRPLIPFPSR